MRSTDSLADSARRTFAEAFDPKRNAFGFFRLALAVLVIFSHTFSLGGFGIDPLEALTSARHSLGIVSVTMFFILSGFLICRSAAGPLSVSRFLWHRALRIFPAYWVCLLLCACVFAPVVACHESGAFLWIFSAPRDSPQKFVATNAAIFQLNGFSIEGFLRVSDNTIAGLLFRNPHPHAINGSLWSLPFEITCYLAVAGLAALGVLRRARVLVLVLFLSFWALYAFEYLNPDAFRRCFPYSGMQLLVMLCLFFFAGCTCFLYREKIPASLTLFLISLLAMAGSFPLGVFGVVAPLALPYAFLWLAFSLPFGWFEKKGDFSYGLYIYAFPVQQGLALLRFHEEGFVLYFSWSVLASLLLAFLSHRLIEAPSLKLKSMQIPAFFRRRAPVIAPPLPAGASFIPESANLGTDFRAPAH